MKISLAIHFPLCLSRHFRLFFSTLDEFLDLFDVFFDPHYARVETKNTSKMSRNSSRVEKYVEKLDKHSRK